MSNLDDFFKKRDKKKKVTTKAKFSTIDPEELAKNLEASTINKTEDVVDSSKFSEDQERVEKTTDNLDGDGEWKPFDSDENKDYTGLRINTQTWQEEDEENEQTGVTDENIKQVSCPWGSKGKPKNDDEDDNEDEEEKDEEDKNESAQEPKTIAAVLAENTIASNVASEPKTEAVAAPTPGAYIPPSMRARMQAEAATKAPAPTPAPSSGGGAYVPPSMRNRTAESSGGAGYEIPTSSVNYRRPNKAQPNFNDCLEFPSLDATGESGAEKGVNGEERFEFAKKSGRVEPKSEKDRQINLQNKFATLSGNQ